MPRSEHPGDVRQEVHAGRRWRQGRELGFRVGVGAAGDIEDDLDDLTVGELEPVLAAERPFHGPEGHTSCWLVVRARGPVGARSVLAGPTYLGFTLGWPRSGGHGTTGPALA